MRPGHVRPAIPAVARRTGVWAVLVGLALLVVAPAHAEDPGPEPAAARALRVTASRTGVSVTAREAPLEDLLRELSRATGVAVYFETNLDRRITRQPVTVSYRNTSVESVLRHILKGTSFVFGYGPDRLDEVRVFASGAGPYNRLAPATAGRARGGSPGAGTDEEQEIAKLEKAALSDTDPGERASALARLGMLTDEARARSVALSVLDREQDLEVLREALNILELQDEVPRERLMTFVNGARPAEVRLQALDLLADTRSGDAAFRRLVSGLTRDRDAEVRERARELLEELDDDQE
jgi:hypothetical protein